MTPGEKIRALIEQGFRPWSPAGGEYDFRSQDDSDGQGPYIPEWNSEKSCPFPELVRQRLAKAAADAIRRPAS